MNTQLLSSKQ